MDNKESKEYLKEFLKKIEKEQEVGPFPTRDSGEVKEYKKKLESNAIRYDDEPVIACPLCHNLNIRDTEEGIECFNCGNLIEEKDLIVFSSIYKYKLASEGSNDTDDS